MYTRRIERIVAVTDAQKSCRKLESLGPEPRHLFERRAGAERTVRLAMNRRCLRASAFADAGDAREQRRRGGVDVDPDGVDAILDHRIERARQFLLGEVVLVLARRRSTCGSILTSSASGSCKPPRDRGRAAQRHVEPGQLLRGAKAEAE